MGSAFNQTWHSFPEAAHEESTRDGSRGIARQSIGDVGPESDHGLGTTEWVEVCSGDVTGGHDKVASRHQEGRKCYNVATLHSRLQIHHLLPEGSS